MLWRVRLRRISDRKIRKNFAARRRPPQNFAFEIAGDRSEIHAGRWLLSMLTPLEIPSNCSERRHAAAREIACDFNATEIFAKFSRPQNFAFEIACDRAEIHATR